MFVKVVVGVKSVQRTEGVFAVVGEFRLSDAEESVRVEEFALKVYGFGLVGVAGEGHVCFVESVVFCLDKVKVACDY